VGPSGDIPPGNPGSKWVLCRKCGKRSRKRGRWDSGCPQIGCDGGPDDIVLVSPPRDQ